MDFNSKDFQQMMSSFMQNAQKIKEGFASAYQDIAEKNKDKKVVGKAGGDLVVAHVNLKLQVVELELKPELFLEKPAVVSELIMSAINQGLYLAQEALKQAMMGMAHGI